MRKIPSQRKVNQCGSLLSSIDPYHFRFPPTDEEVVFVHLRNYLLFEKGAITVSRPSFRWSIS